MKLYCTCRSAGKTDKIDTPLQSTIIVSISFFFVYSAFMSIQALQNSLNMEDGLGVKTLACLYSTSVVSSVLAPTFIKVVGGKLTLVCAFCCHTIYTLSNFYPNFYTLIPSSILLGMATGPLWTAQNLYITASASRIAEKSSKQLIHILDRHNGIFYSVLGLAFASGALVSSVIFRHEILPVSNATKLCGSKLLSLIETNMTSAPDIKSKPSDDLLMQLFGVYLGFDFIGIIVTAFFLPTLPLSDWIKKKSVCKSLYSTFSSLSDYKLLLFLPMPVAIAVQRFLLYADFTRAFITCPYGVGMVGFVMASYAVTNTLFLQIIPRVAKYIKRQILVAFATVTNLIEMILWIFWNPSVSDLSMVFLSAIAWGITDSIWRLEIFGMAPVLFAHKKEPAFANLHFWRGLMSAVYFGTASYLSVFIKLIICIVTLFTSICLYTILDCLTNRPVETTDISIPEAETEDKQCQEDVKFIKS